MVKEITYTWQEQALFYGRKFLVSLVPVLVALPIASWTDNVWIGAFVVPSIVCLDKAMRSAGWYDWKG